jgi:hypothetical protein
VKAKTIEAIGILAVVLIGGILLVWHYEVRVPRIESQVWEGIITAKHKKAVWWKAVIALSSKRRRVSGSRRRDPYDYYWDVETADGVTMSVKVPDFIWEDGNVGDAVRKVEGEYYPDVYDPKPTQEEEMFGMFFKGQQPSKQ